MSEKKLYFIYNPKAGKGQIRTHLLDIIDIFVKAGYQVTARPTQFAGEAVMLAQNVPELDLIISGHTHTRLDEAIVHGDTYITSVEEYGKYLGDISMTQKENGRWNLDNYELITVDTSIKPDAATQAKIDEIAAMIDKE